MLNPKFVRYEENNDPETLAKGFLGVATISCCDNKLVLRYKIQKGKNGGVFPTPFSTKMNGEWCTAFTIDSNIASEEIADLIKKGMSAPKGMQKSMFEASQTPSPTYVQDECPF